MTTTIDVHWNDVPSLRGRRRSGDLSDRRQGGRRRGSWSSASIKTTAPTSRCPTDAPRPPSSPARCRRRRLLRRRCVDRAAAVASGSPAADRAARAGADQRCTPGGRSVRRPGCRCTSRRRMSIGAAGSSAEPRSMMASRGVQVSRSPGRTCARRRLPGSGTGAPDGPAPPSTTFTLGPNVCPSTKLKNFVAADRDRGHGRVRWSSGACTKRGSKVLPTDGGVMSQRLVGRWIDDAAKRLKKG